MKNSLVKRILVAAVTAAMVLSMAACGQKEESAGGDDASTEEGSTNESGGEISVDVILKTTASEYWGYVKAGAEAYGEENEGVKVEVKGATSETAYDEQANMIESDLNSGAYDAYVIAPLQADTGVQGDGTVNARLAGYQKGVEAAGGEFLADETQYADAVADKAVTCMEAIMQNHPEGIAIIACNNDDIAMGAARAAKDNEAYKDTIFVGFDGIQSACEAIIKGEETMSVAQEAYDMGYKAVEAAVKATQGEKLDEFIDSGCSVVDETNAQDRMDTLKSYLG